MRSFLPIGRIAKVLVGFLLCWKSCFPAYAGTAAAECKSRTSDLACAIFVSRFDGAAVRMKPNDVAEVSSRLTLAQSVRINWKITKTSDGQWMYVEGKSDHPNDISPEGWVRTKELAGEIDFREVTDCWPFASVFDDTQVDGTELAVEFSRRGKSASGKIQVWSAGTLIRIGVSRRDSLIYGYNPETFKLFFAGNEYDGPHTTLFSPPVLPHCNGLRIRQ